MSDTEKFYAAVQAHLGGNVPLGALHPMQQMQVIQGINAILQVASLQQGQQ